MFKNDYEFVQFCLIIVEFQFLSVYICLKSISKLV